MLSPTSLVSRSRGAAGRVVLALVLLCSSLSCYAERITSWDDLDPYLRFRVDGTLVEYRSLGELFGQYQHFSRSGRDALNVVGWDDTTGFHLSVSSVRDYPGLGTYTIDREATDPTFRMGMYYQPPDSIGYLTRENATIEFTHVGPSSIGGTFSGVLRSEGLPDIMITDGEFMVRRELESRVEN